MEVVSDLMGRRELKAGENSRVLRMEICTLSEALIIR
jgi:hypothetical protein